MTRGPGVQQQLFHAPRVETLDWRKIGTACLDCGVETFAIGEAYMVHDELWRAACPWNADGRMFDFLCVGCLEKRIGRRLVARDFKDAPINCLHPTNSRRLRDRLGERARLVERALVG
jgi:hypothetical protein